MRIRLRLTDAPGYPIEGDARRPPTEGEPFEFTDDDGDEYETSPVVAVLADGVFVTDRVTYTLEVLDPIGFAVARRMARA